MGNSRGVLGYLHGGNGGGSYGMSPDQIVEDIGTEDPDLGTVRGQDRSGELIICKTAGLNGTAAERQANQERVGELTNASVQKSRSKTGMSGLDRYKSSGRWEDNH